MEFDFPSFRYSTFSFPDINLSFSYPIGTTFLEIDAIVKGLNPINFEVSMDKSQGHSY